MKNPGPLAIRMSVGDQSSAKGLAPPERQAGGMREEGQNPQDVSLLSSLPHTRPTGMWNLFLSQEVSFVDLYTLWSCNRKLKYMGTRGGSKFCGAWDLHNLEVTSSWRKTTRKWFHFYRFYKKRPGEFIVRLPSGSWKGQVMSPEAWAWLAARSILLWRDL